MTVHSSDESNKIETFFPVNSSFASDVPSPPCWMTINKIILVSVIVLMIQHGVRVCHLKLSVMAANHVYLCCFCEGRIVCFCLPSAKRSEIRNDLAIELVHNETNSLPPPEDCISFILQYQFGIKT